MKKISAILLALIMMLSMVAMAADEGTITINDAVIGETYTIYRIADLEDYQVDENGNAVEDGAYAYVANTAWLAWLKTQTTYVIVDAENHVTWKNGADAAAFAKAAKAFADENDIAPAAEAVTATSATVEFTELPLGWYLVDTTLGTLCSLDTTDKTVVIEEKNTEPTVVKEVQEGETWGESNTAEIGDTVEFKTTIKAYKGAQNYVLHDKAEAGLTINVDSIEIAGLTKGTEYTVVSSGDALCADCDFHIVFAQTYLDTINAETTIVVTYDAILNENAEISTGTNDNSTKLDYGDNSDTEWDTTTTSTFMFDIVKTNSFKKLISGAKFELTDVDENKVAFVAVEGGYRVATDAEIESETVVTTTTIEAGKVNVSGLDKEVYTLKEIEAPEGYNLLANDITVDLSNGNNVTSMTGDTWAEGNGGVQITNNSGSELPSTGGIGTTIFYTVGGLMMAAAIVLLVAKKKVAASK